MVEKIMQGYKDEFFEHFGEFLAVHEAEKTAGGEYDLAVQAAMKKVMKVREMNQQGNDRAPVVYTDLYGELWKLYMHEECPEREGDWIYMMLLQLMKIALKLQRAAVFMTADDKKAA